MLTGIKFLFANLYHLDLVIDRWSLEILQVQTTTKQVWRLGLIANAVNHSIYTILITLYKHL